MAMNPAQAAQNIKARIDKLDPSIPQDNEDSIVPFAEEILAQVGDPDGEGGYTIKSEDVYFSSSSTNLLQEGTVKFVLESVDNYLESYAEDIGANNDNLQSHLSSTAAHEAANISYDNTTSGLTATDAKNAIDEAVATSSSSLQTHIDNTAAHAASDITTDPSFDANVSSTDVQAMFQEFKSIIDSNIGVLAELP